MSARRRLSLVLMAGLLVAPSPAVALAVLGAGLAVFMGGDLVRALRRRQAGSRGAPVDAVALGVDRAGRRVQLTDDQLAAHGLIVGASGAGKSTTLLTILSAQIRQGRPVVVIDMKGSPGFAAQLGAAAAQAGRGLRIWSPDGPGHWNPLAHGNPTSLKDKLILTERFSEPHYQRAAERYVQTAIEVLAATHPERPVQLHEVVSVMEPRRLGAVLRGVGGPLRDRVGDYLSTLSPDQVSGIRGLGTRLALITESTAGPFLRGARTAGANEIDLGGALAGGDVVLMSLNSSVYGQLAAQLGALAIQDLVAATGTRLGAAGPLADGARPDSAHPSGRRLPATIAIDEFSALGADNVLSLLARGRESGVSCLLATQEMADLERAGRGFRDQVLGIVAVKIVHRQDVPGSAELVAQMAGTERVWERTETIRGMWTPSGAARGTRRQVERYVVHPNDLKTLAPGEAYLMRKLPRADVRRVDVRRDGPER